MRSVDAIVLLASLSKIRFSAKQTAITTTTTEKAHSLYFGQCSALEATTTKMNVFFLIFESYYIVHVLVWFDFLSQ